VPWRPLPGDDPPPAKLAAPLDRLMRNLGGPGAGTVRSVFDAWTELVGPSVAAHVEPLSLRKGRLVVSVEDPAWATQLRFLEAQLLTRLAETFGPDEVTAIDVRVRPRP
jgi:predicted nucleic acid-binding Zn ribbon protein